MRPARPLLFALVFPLAVGCSSSSSDSGGAPPPAGSPGTAAAFDLDAALASPEHFHDFPYPSDLRLDAQGRPDLAGFPNPYGNKIVTTLVAAAADRTGVPTMPVAWFRFGAPVAERSYRDLIAADAASPVLLVDVDLASPDRGKLIPTVAHTLPVDDYTPENLLGVAPWPGFVLHPKRTYAFVVQRALGDAEGHPLGVPAGLATLAAGGTPAGALAAKAAAVYAPLFETLDTIGVARSEVAAATVFTTSDVVADLHELSEKVKAKYAPEIVELAYDDHGGAGYEGFCRVNAKIVYPQFQKGTPPFDADGLFEMGDDGLPVKQREETAPVVLTFPKSPMPAKGYPLDVYFHGSGGVSAQAVDRGPVVTPGGANTPGKGPAYVLAPFGIATAASALPLNPERLPGADDYAYLNLKNLAAFRDTFRQGTLEQRLFIEALRTLEIPASVLASCDGATLPDGVTSFRYDPDLLLAQGQSMGGMYTNMVGGVEPRIRAAVPTGAGGYWSYQLLVTSAIPGAKPLVAATIGSSGVDLVFLHPALHMLETAWESAEPMVYMPRLAREPLPGHPVVSIYEPVGKDDPDFPDPIYDAVALAYGHKQAGDQHWPEMQKALKLQGLDGVLPYPIEDDVASADGTKYTGVVVQYLSDGIIDSHAIYSQLDAVKHQYGCFFDSFVRTGKARVVAPGDVGSPCE